MYPALFILILGYNVDDDNNNNNNNGDSRDDDDNNIYNDNYYDINLA